jgi:hypothetical protein
VSSGLPSSATSSHVPSPGGGVAVLLPVFVAEAGWRAHRSHAAMAHVLQRWASRHGATLEDAANALVWAHSNARRDRPWLTRLTPACAEPAGYPWRWPRELCLAAVARAEAFLRGELRDPSPRATGWRSPGRALARALARGCSRVRCAGGCSIRMVVC